jgi:hypothetical protein
MLQSALAALHGLVALASLSCWAGAMYCWWVVNGSLKPGQSRLVLLFPTSYFQSERFTPRGNSHRLWVFRLFAAMIALALVAWLLRQVLESSVAA